MLLRWLPVPHPDRLVLFHTEGQDPGWAIADNFETVYSYPNYKELRDRWLNLIARIKSGISNDTAQAATRVLFKAIRDEDLPKIRPMKPSERDDYLRRTIELRPAARGINMLSEFWRTPLTVLMAMVRLSGRPVLAALQLPPPSTLLNAPPFATACRPRQL